MFSILIQVLKALEAHKTDSPTIPLIRHEIERKINSLEYQQSKISSTGLRRYLDSAESLGLINQSKAMTGEEYVSLTNKAKLLAGWNGSSRLENFHLRNLKFPFDPLDLTRLSSEELLLCQFRADISTDIEDRVIELYWKRRASFLEDGSSWSEGVKPSQMKGGISPPPTPPNSIQNLPIQSVIPTQPKHFIAPTSRSSGLDTQRKSIARQTPSSSEEHSKNLVSSNIRPVAPVNISLPSSTTLPSSVLTSLFQLYIQFPGQYPLPSSLSKVPEQQAFFVKALGSIGWTYFHSTKKFRFYLAFDTKSKRDSAEAYVLKAFVPVGSSHDSTRIPVVEKGGTQELWTWEDFEETFTAKWTRDGKKRIRDEVEDSTAEKRLRAEFNLNVSVGKLNALLGKFRHDRDSGSVLSRGKCQGKEKEVATREWKKSNLDITSRPSPGTKINWGSSSSQRRPDLQLSLQPQARTSDVTLASKPTQSLIPTPMQIARSTIVRPNAINSSPPPSVTLLLSRLPTNRNPRAPDTQHDNSATTTTTEVAYSPIPEELDQSLEYVRSQSAALEDTISPPSNSEAATLSKDRDSPPAASAAEAVGNQDVSANSADHSSTVIDEDQEQDVLSFIPVPETNAGIAQNLEHPQASAEQESEVEDNQVALTLLPTSEKRGVDQEQENFSRSPTSGPVQKMEAEVLDSVSSIKKDSGMNDDSDDSDFVLVGNEEEWEDVELKDETTGEGESEGEVEGEKTKVDIMDEDELIY